MRALLGVMSVALMLAVTGCGSDPTDSSVASADSAQDDGESADDGQAADGAGGGGVPADDAERHEMNLKFAQCMREHGIDMEDPKPGEGIQLKIDGPPGTADAAIEACKEYMPQPPPGEAEEAREDMLAFAQCMRDNGVENFEDPKPGEGIRIGPEIGEDPDFAQAEKTCQDTLGAGGERVENRS
jgi:hypothetical protein